MFCSLGDVHQLGNGVAFVSCCLQAFCTFSFKCRNSHWLIAKVRFEDCNNINSRQKAKIRCYCLAVSCGLEIASLLTESEQWCSHNIVTRRLCIKPPPPLQKYFPPAPFLVCSSQFASTWIWKQIFSAKVVPIKRCGFVPRHA